MRMKNLLCLSAAALRLTCFSPREAAVSIVNYVNHRNPNVSLLALSVLRPPSSWLLDVLTVL